MDNSIREWLSGKTVLITGGTGFMGKVLLEKLLRSCPGIEKVYVMCRYKKNLSPSIRIVDLLKLPVKNNLHSKLLEKNLLLLLFEVGTCQTPNLENFALPLLICESENLVGLHSTIALAQEG